MITVNFIRNISLFTFLLLQLPPEWSDQFASGIQANSMLCYFPLPLPFILFFLLHFYVIISSKFLFHVKQTIAVIQAGHGLLQLGSCKIIPEDLHFVLRMRHMFESLGYQSGFFLSQLFSSTRNNTPSPPAPLKQTPTRPPPPLFNWNNPQLPSSSPVLPNSFHASARMRLPNNKDDPHIFHHLPHSSEAQMDEMMPEHEQDLKWPNGLSFFTALTGRADDAKVLLGADGLGSIPPSQQHPLLNLCGNSEEAKASSESHGNRSEANAEDYLGLESHSNKVRKMENNKFKRSFTLPARMSSSPSSSSLVDHHHHAATPQGMDYRGNESGMYPDLMESLLE